MADSYMVDVNNREQIKEFLVYVSTSPDGVKMGAKAVSLMGSTLTSAQRLPTYLLDSAGNPAENTEGTLLPSAARPTVAGSPIQTNRTAKGVAIYLDVTANPGGTETLTIFFRLRDNSAGKNLSSWLASFQIPAATNGTYALIIYPGASSAPDGPTNNKAYALPCPPSWYATVGPSGVGSWTYQMDFAYII